MRVQFVDCRWQLGHPEIGRELYLAGHIPGASFLDVETELSAPPGGADGGRHPLPAPEDFARAAGAAGIGSDTLVVVYDQGMNGGAARLWWLLRHFGHDDVAVLRGGLEDWLGPLRSGEERIEPADFRLRPREDDLIPAEEIEERLGKPGFVLVDARAAERYRGEVEPIDPVAGHIPGAVNMPYTAEPTALDPDAEVAVYCGSGITAAVTILALERAGVAARLYPGSWSEWSTRGLRSSVAEFTVRPARPEDTEAVFELYAEWQRANYGQVEIGREMYATILASADGAFVAELDGRVVGEADVSGGWIDVGVEPSVRRRGIGTALLQAAEDAATAQPTLVMGLQSDPPGAAFALTSGYERAWEVWLMGIDLPDEIPEPEWPEGVSVRTYGGEEAEAREIKELLDLAYAEEFHHQADTFENWSRFMFDDPMFDAGVWFLAVAEGRIVGAALNWDEGYIKDLVVHPEWRGRGLGKALVHQTFGEFRRRGLPRVTLKTDSNNPTDAWRLYERVGMRKERTYEVFRKG